MWHYIVYDFETGGLSSEKNPVTEIALKVVNGITLDTIQEYSTFVQNYDNLEYNDQALKITGITQNQIKSGIKAEELVKKLIEIFKNNTNGKGTWKKKPILVAHNGDNFDIKFMRYLFERMKENLYDYVELHTEDTMWLSRNFWQGENNEGQKYNLSACCEKVNITVNDTHRAMDDVELTLQLFKFFLNKMRKQNTVSNTENTDERSWREKVNFKF